MAYRTDGYRKEKSRDDRREIQAREVLLCEKSRTKQMMGAEKKDRKSGKNEEGGG